MQKIPTIFVRDGNFKVGPAWHPDCTWVRDGEGAATEKLHGTNVRLTLRSGHCVRVEKRRNPSKANKADGITDPWYVDTNLDDKWILDAVLCTDTELWPDGEHCCEALGPKIQGNALGLERHVCVPFDLWAPHYELWADRSFTTLRDLVTTLPSLYSPGHVAEGIVFHHPDGRRAKIKGKDFTT